MASSLQKQVLYRLLAAFIASGLVVITATVWFQARAVGKTVLSRQQDIVGHFQGRMADLHREWEAQAAQLKLNLEFTRILESRRPELVKSFFSIQSNSEFNHVIITDPRGVLLLQYGVDDEMKKAVSPSKKREPWFYHPIQKTLYHVLTIPVWLGNAETGFLFLLKPMDNALLGHIAYPRTDLYLLLNGQSLASSLGGKGVEQFPGVDGKTSIKGTRYTQVSIPWKDTRQRSDVSPTLIIRTQIRDSLSGFEIALIVIAALVVLAATSRFVIGAWIGGIISDIVILKTSSDTFARERKLPLTAGLPCSGERAARGDELGALRTGMVSMMQTVIESELRFREGEEVLRKEHDFSASLVDTAPVIILLLDTQGMIQYVNPYFEQLAGYRMDEIKGREWFTTFLPVGDRERIRALFLTATHDVPVRCNINPIVTRNGEEREIEWNGQAMRDGQGNVTTVLSIGLDITERKHAEEKYRNILQTAIDGFWTTDSRGRLLEVNEAYCRMSGYSRDELLSMSVPDLEAVENPDEIAKHIEKMIAQGSDRFESKHRRKDGTVYDVEASVQHSNEQGGIFIGFIKDITERKRVEKALLEREEQLRQAMDATHDGLWDWNLVTGEVYYSPNYFRMLGYEPGELSGGSEIWADRIHPDDREGALRANQDCIDNRIRNIEVEFRMRSKSDAWIWILGRGKAVLRDDSGKALRMIGTHVDITEIKLAEETILAALAEKELLLKEIHHRVKNNLQIIASLLYLQAEDVEDPHTRNLIRESRDRIKSMALVHEKLYSSTDLSRIDFMEYSESLSAYLFSVYGAAARGIQLETRGRGIFLGVDTAIPCGLILSELLSNALKYAFPDGRHGIVRITASLDAAGDLDLVIRDDGIGLPPALAFGNVKTLGLRLVHKLTEQVRGSMNAYSDNGAVFHFTIPPNRRKEKDLANG